MWRVESKNKMDKGWVLIHRKLKDKGFYNKSCYVHLWIHILLSANHKPKEFMWNNNTIIVKEGQFITGRKELSKVTGIPETTIERILEYLEKEHQIGQQKTTKYRLITVVNWKEYQIKDNKRTTNGQQTDTNKEYNNVKNIKKDTNTETSSVDIPILIKAFEGLNPASKKFYGIPTQRKACQALIDTYGLERVKTVIEKTLPKTNGLQFFPTITTPLQLQDKWVQLESAIRKYQSEKLITKEKYKII